MTNDQITHLEQSICLKTGYMSYTSLQFVQLTPSTLTQELNELGRQAPKLFDEMPIVIDLSQLNLLNEDKFTESMALLQASSLKIIGIIPPKSSINLHVPWPNLTHLSQKKVKYSKDKISTLSIKKVYGKIRSGQLIKAPNQHLVVYGDVSSGSELYAAGDIHIFGTLSGRAFAGAMGAKDAQIACQNLQAEMVAISGIYSSYDGFKSECVNHGATYIYLNKNSLVFKLV